MKSLFLLSVFTFLFGSSMAQTPKKTEVVSLDGSDIYYEVYGDGDPLFLLHGYTVSSLASFQKNFLKKIETFYTNSPTTGN